MGLLSAARQRADQHAGGSGAELPPLGRYSDVAPSAPPLPTSGYGGGGGSTRRAPLYPHDAYAPRPGAASSGGGVGGGTGGGGGAAYSKGAQWPLPAGDVATGYPVPDVPAGAAGSGLTTPAAGKPAEGVAAVLGRLAGLFGGRGGEGRERGRGWGWGRGRTAAAGQDVGPAAVSAEEGRRIMLEQRDMLFADASLFRINEHTGEVVAVVEGDALRLRLRSPDPRRGGSWGASSSRGGWGPAAGEEVVRLTVGDAACVDLNPPGAEPLPLLHAGPGVYTFRAGPGRLLLYPPGLGLLGLGPDSDGAYSGGSSGSGGEAEGDMKGAAWPVAPASSYPQVPYEPHQQHRHRHKRGGGEQAAAQDGGGDGYYYCLTVSPTICDSCGLDELDGVMAAYCRFSGISGPPPAVAPAGKTAAAAAAPGGAAEYPSIPPTSAHTIPGAPPFYPAIQHPPDSGDIVPYQRPLYEPYEQPHRPSSPSFMHYATGAVLAAATSPDAANRIGARVVATARVGGQWLVEGAHHVAYGIRSRTDQLGRTLPDHRHAHAYARRSAHSPVALPARAVVVGVWLLARAAALVVNLVTELLASLGAWAAEVVLFGGALLGRWLPSLAALTGAAAASRRRSRRRHGRRGHEEEDEAPSLRPLLRLLLGAAAASRLPGHLAKAAAGTVLLVYGELHGSLEEAARVLLAAIADAASELAGRAGGTDAEGLVRGSLEAAGYGLDAMTGWRKVGLRAVAREFQRRHAAAMLAAEPAAAPQPPPPTRGPWRRR